MGGQNANAKAQQTLGNTAAATSQGNANAFGGQEQGLFSTLFGKPGGNAASGGGTLSGMMSPSSLNVNAPTGPYALQYNQAKAQGAPASRAMPAQQSLSPLKEALDSGHTTLLDRSPVRGPR